MKFKSLLTGVLLAFGFGTVAFAADVKVGFVYVGPVGDYGWTYEHNEGRLAIEEHFGDRVETIYQESVAYGADAERAITTMAMQGADLIFTTSFGYMDPTLSVAEKFPNVKFEHATGFKRSENVSTYSGRFYEGRAIQGHIAGKMTKTNKIGYIGSYPIPEVVRGINSAYLHAKKVNPDVEFNIIWIYTWFDPAKEADAAKALIDQGADVILQHTDSTAPQAAAKEAGNVITFGQASDMGEYAPMPRVSSIIDDWAPYYVARVQAVLDGTWKKSDTWGDMKSGMVKMAPYTNMTPSVAALAAQLEGNIKNGTFDPFGGKYTIGELLTMNKYVKGIDASLPK